MPADKESKKRKLVFYTENYVYGGLEKFLFDTVNNIHREKYEITLLFNRNSDLEKRISANVGGHVNKKAVDIMSAVPLFTWVDRRSYPPQIKRLLKGLVYLSKYACFLGNVVILKREFSKVHADVIHVVNGGYPGGDSCLSACVAGKKQRSIVLMSILSCPYPRRLKPVEKIIDLLVAKNTDLTLSLFCKANDAMSRLHDFPPEKLMVIYNGINAEEVDRSPELRMTLNIPQGVKVVGTIGALEPVKGHMTFLRAVTLLKEKGDGIRYVLIGDGSQRSKLEAYAKENNLLGEVIFAGYLTGSSQGFMKLFDIFIMPSDVEGLPYAVMEAMSAARPIIATSVGGIPDELGDCGIIIPPGEPQQLADAIMRLLGNEKNAKDMGEKAKKRFMEMFSLDEMIISLERVYDRF